MSSSNLIYIFIVLLILLEKSTICCQSKNNVTSNCVLSEKTTLLKFKTSFSVDLSRYSLSSWEANTDCCGWPGVECDNATGHVVGLHLARLYGLTIDDITWVGNLSSLEYLDMSGIGLSTTIDVIKVLTTLPSLVDLRLRGTGLNDKNLPHTNCVNKSSLLFTNVQHLDLSGNSFGENSSFCFLHNMTTLSFLDLSHNLLHHKADWISDFLWDKCHLKSLNLGSNQFYGDISGAFKNLSGCWDRNLESLDFSWNEFDGHLPEEIGEMKQLTKLDVKDNKLCGPIPSSIGNLKALRYMILANNKLGGGIPTSFGQLSNLEWIDMQYNSLGGILSEAHFDKLSKLEYLEMESNDRTKFNVGDDWLPPFQLKILKMGSNRIEGQFPQWIKTQKSLEYLSLSNCRISGTLPTWLGSLKNLTYLKLSNNHFEGSIIPELPFGLRYLDLSRNFISGSIPESLCQMKDLQNVDLSGNHLSGHFSNCNWGNLSSLTLARLSSNQLSGAIPNSIGGAYQLRWLQLSNNNFTGQIPFNLKNCTRLSLLDLGDNKLSGNLPQWIGNLRFVGVVRLRNNSFDGDIPPAYCQLGRLQIMDLAHNQLTGFIPRCFGKLSGMIKVEGFYDGAIGRSSLNLNEVMKGAILEYTMTLRYLVNSLDLSSNRLFGEIPSELTKLTGLIGLNLSHNHLRGTIPRRIGDMKSLESFDLSSNSLSGTIPESLSKLTSLILLKMSNNNLSGPIPTGTMPTWLGSLKNFEGPIILDLPSGLAYLDLSRNLINGSIPESLCQMKGLVILDLSRNHLSGHLPDCNWGNIDFLETVLFSSNQLSGPIPHSIGGAYQLRWLQLSNNSLTGKLPSTLTNCTSLSVLDVGDNKLSGKLPEGIGNNWLESMEVLRLRNNKFVGNIPAAYCQLSKVQIMDLALNHLTGNIPHCFGNLSGMIDAGGGFSTEGLGFSEMMKGALMEYTATISQYLVNLDLSSNNLFGQIPSDLTNLIALNGLNLSYNHLGGTIPQRIGDLNSLESFDFSNNKLSGTIPVSLSKLTSLSYLNLSNNNLSGPIPTGPQLQTFNDPSSYDGNPGLCGDPLPKKCNNSNNEIPQQQTWKAENEDGGIKDKIYLYAFIISGLATGFWGYFGVLVFKRTWRLALFRRMDVLIGKMLGRF